MGLLESQLRAIQALQESEELIDKMIDTMTNVIVSTGSEMLQEDIRSLLGSIRICSIAHGRLEKIQEMYLSDGKENTQKGD